MLALLPVVGPVLSLLAAGGRPSLFIYRLIPYQHTWSNSIWTGLLIKKFESLCVTNTDTKQQTSINDK